MCDHPLAGLPSSTIEEANPSGLGIQQSPRPDSGNLGKNNSRVLDETPRRTILGYLQLADPQVGALLPYQS
jgi:hypothetical protein